MTDSRTCLHCWGHAKLTAAIALALISGPVIYAQGNVLPLAPAPAASFTAANSNPGAQLFAALASTDEHLGGAGAAQDSSLSAIPSLTRAQAEALALQNNPQISVSHLLALAQQQVVRQARSGELPQLTGSLTAEDGYDGSRIASGSLSSSRLLEHAGGSLSATQLITDFGRTRNLVAASKLQAQAQLQNEEATRDDVVLVVDQAFYAALEAQATLAVAQQTVATRRSTQTQVQQLTKNNLRSTLDQSFADVDVSQARLLVLDAQNNAQTAMASLDAVLGLDHAQEYTLVSDPAAPPVPPQDVDVLTSMALQQRPDLLALNRTSEAQRKLSHSQDEQMLPTLSALGTVGGEPIRDGRYYISSWDGAVAANLNVPIFNGFLFSAEAKETSLRAEATTAQTKQLRDSIVRDVRTAWLAAQNDFARIAVTQQLLAQADLSLKLAQTRYDLGLSSIVELTDAQLAQTQAEISNTDTLYRYRASLAVLRFQTGQQP